ncbi:hypothetical protein P5G50_12120 [Leifsonia sp. F6_8S_P_1B]|uniref:Uncharacterized protein n=1 Tax=Leifsonia williamsii TaxID=3035919 RepID=A0ABT8KFS5_9MICO|nr:hypothetical protein [Leifsonia williamsii]MDN4615194.1 hypothetical protein [Leifsonia williamsii]
MHPLTIWAIATNSLAEREREAQLLRTQHESGIPQPPPLTRDERWVAAIHRWAAAEPQQQAAPLAPPAPAASAAPRLGCA